MAISEPIATSPNAPTAAAPLLQVGQAGKSGVLGSRRTGELCSCLHGLRMARWGNRVQVEPTPSQTARVFVGRIELITPEVKRSVQDALTSNDRSVIDRYGRFLDPILKSISLENPASRGEIERYRVNVLSSFAATVCR